MRLNLKTIAVIAIIGLAFLWWRSGRTPHYINYPPPARGPWIAFGDSLTEGYGATEGHDYPALLGRKLGVAIQNHGASGEATREGLNRLEALAQLKPRVVLLCFGGNDGLQQLPREETLANLSRMIDRFHQSGAFVVLIGIHSVGLRDHNDKPFKKLAREKSLLYVPDLLEGIMFRPVLMSDALHPNDAGYEVFAGRMKTFLEPLLPQLR